MIDKTKRIMVLVNKRRSLLKWCKEAECEERHFGRGFCRKHYFGIFRKIHKCKDCDKPITMQSTGFCQRCKQMGSRDVNWKGDKVGYTALHDWVRLHYGSANRCDNPTCEGISKNYQWANLSHKYKRDRDDFQMMCQKCHSRYDHDYRARLKDIIGGEKCLK